MRRQLIVLGATLAVVLLVVTAFVCLTLYQSRQRYYANAEETSRNLAISLENYLDSYFREVDLALRRAAAEFRLQHEQQHFNDAAFSDYLRSLKERVPQARSIRGSNRDGQVIYGEDVDVAHPQDLSIREFFQRAKTERDLIFGVPVKSRITGEMLFPLIYPLTLPDGSFGGSAYINMNNSSITELFSSLNLGKHGVITLLDKQHRILHRFPEESDAAIGSQVPISNATLAMLTSTMRRSTYLAVSKRDGLERVISAGQIGAYPVYVLVALSSDDFLVTWYKEFRSDAFFLASLYLLSAALLLGARLALRRQYEVLGEIVRKDEALQESVVALTKSELRWRSLTEGLPQMVWTVTPDLRFDFLSRHWQDYTGETEQSLRAGNAWSAIIHPEDKAEFDAKWRLARSERSQFRCDCRLRRQDGAWCVFENYALPQKNEDGDVVCWVGSSTDMTETRAAHADLLRAKDQALEAGRAKSDFVANMSHEIRSPMNAVLGMLQLLQNTPMDLRQRDYAGKAESAARALLGLLNDILDFSKIESGKLLLDSHIFSLDKLLRDLSAILSGNVGSKQVELLFNIDSALPDRMIGDGMRIQQVLLNLCGNAVKFTEQGEVELCVRLERRIDSALHVVFSIRDTGIGISDEHRQRLFEGFSQAEASTARRFGGTGLGLTISQRLVRLMGGELRVESELGRGSVFEFSVTLQAVAPEAEAEDGGSRMRELECLVVDDNPSAREVLAAMACSFGWRVDTVENGRDAVTAVAKRAAEQPYDVLFVDWRMPDLDGWETSRQIRQLAVQGAAVPLIIMVTAYERELLAQKQASMEETGLLDGMLAKPFTASTLFNAVLEVRVGLRSSAIIEPSPSLGRLHGLHLLLVEDNPLNQQVALELLKHEGAVVELADCGQSAIDLLQRSDQALPHLILMDIQMPVMDGHQATRAIRAQLGPLAPPIVAMTANAMEADREAARDAGMVDHIGKPFDLTRLVALILHHSNRTGSEAAVPAQLADTATPPLQGATAPSDLPEIDSAAALGRLGGTLPLYLKVLRSFSDELMSMAGELNASLQQQRVDSALPVLHTLKGLAGTVGAMQLAALATATEKACKSLREAGTPHEDMDVNSGQHRCWQMVSDVLAALPPTKSAADRLAKVLDAET
ncbi:MAG TPA: response regulator [Burkholderiaceae bacterium]